jgi:capsular polysaccharide biosynthesis protein
VHRHFYYGRVPDMLDITAVTEKTDLVEDCGPSRRPRWIASRRPLSHPERNPFLAWETMPDVRIHAWRVRDVVLDATTMILLRDGKIIRETNYLRPAEELEQLRVDPARLTRIEADLPVLICGDAWSTNHYHFLNHTLPGIDSAITRHGKGGIVLAAHWMRPVHEKALRLLGHDGVATFQLEPGRQYEIADAEFCSYTTGTADFANSAHIQAMHNRMASKVPASDGAGKKIYISRLADKHRRAEGEAELVEALRRRRFAIVTPADHTLAQQIDIFRAADLVVGPHGAGLANIAFCRPNAAIYDVLPEHFIDSSILNLAIRRDLRSWIDAFPGHGDGTDHTRDWVLDVPAIMARVNEIDPRSWFRGRK